MGIKERRGQSSLEYIIVASFVVIAITTVSFLMWQSGVLDPSHTNRGSTGFSQVNVQDWALFLEPNEEVGLVLVNEGGNSINVTKVSATIGNISQCSDTGKSVLVPGARETRELNCNQPVSGYTIGDFYQANVEIEYEISGSGQKSTSKGKIWGPTEKGEVTVSTVVTTSTTSTTSGVTCDNNCNGNCSHPGCSVNQDPDCGCKSGDGCCGIGCTPTEDSDCASCVKTCPSNEPGCLSSDPGGNTHEDSTKTCCSTGEDCYVCDSGYSWNSTSGSCESTCTVTCSTGPGCHSSDPDPGDTHTTGDECCSSSLDCYACNSGLSWDSSTGGCVPGGCAPDGCNGICPAGCTGSDDPDCAGECLDCSCDTDLDCSTSCAAGDGCCPSCTPPDPDCSAPCTPDGCNDNCPANCTGAEDPDCSGMCLNCSCPSDDDCAATCAAGDGCCPRPSCSPPDPDCSGNPTLSCSIVNGPCDSDETCVYKMSSVGSHAGTCASAFPYSVCCSVNIGSLDGSCASDEGVLSLSSDDNAHAEEYNTWGYPEDVCLSHSTGTVNCSYTESCSYTCLGSMSASTNAHVSDCGGFNTKICCRID